MAHVTDFSSCGNRENKSSKCSSNKPNIPNSLVRIVLFKECRLKERQLLFDSSMSDGAIFEEMSKTQSWFLSKIPCNRFTEEYSHISELIFGSTAMRFDGTYYKIHSMSTSQNLLFTQVFPTPVRLNKSETILKNSKLFLGSYNSEREDPIFEKRGSTSSESSISIFRKSESDRSNTTSTIDSGFTETSFTSIPTSVSQISNLSRNFSHDMSFKDDSRVSISHLESSDSLLTPNPSSQICTKPRKSYSRMGLAVFIATPEELELYIQCYAYFIEHLLDRIRQCIECSINSLTNFTTVMNDLTKDADNFVKRLLSQIILRKGESKNAKSNPLESNNSNKFLISKIINEKWKSLSQALSCVFRRNKEVDYFNRWCRLLVEYDTKEKNFFLTSILTALLTFHPGWIESCYELPSLKNTVSLSNSYNALWHHLSNYSGSFIENKKIVKVVLHSNQNKYDVINDVVEFLRYFIRSFRVQRRHIERDRIEEDNERINFILSKHKRRKSSIGSNKLNSCNNTSTEKPSLTRTKTFTGNLATLASLEDCFDPVPDDDPVIFILGDNEKLVNIKEERNYEIFGDLEMEDANEENTQNETPNLNGKMNIIEFPLPQEKMCEDFSEVAPYEYSLNSDPLKHMLPEGFLQCCISSEKQLQEKLNNEIFSHKYSHPIDNNSEVVVVLGKTDEMQVQLISSKRSGRCDTVDISHLVADMLEVTQNMRTLGIPKQYCFTHIEQRLHEICLRSNALANLLLTTDFCTMDFLLSSLNIEPSDVPLLMSVASTLYPEIAQKYGISYQ